MKPRLQYLAVNGQLTLASRRPGRLYRYRWLMVGAGLLMVQGLVLLVAARMGPW